jgi:NAD(P)-dependent dehydrogenase (short-subunit alcohol dehydrogenase family)
MTQSAGRKSIFITGAASGMGRATALHFAAKGWFVGATDVNQPALATLLHDIGPENGTTATLDVTDPAAFEGAMADFGRATGGTLDLMFSNAGIALGGLFDEMSWADIMKIVSVNFLGVMIGIRAATPLLRATQGALCLVNASSSAIFGTATIAVYSATKHAVRGLTEALAIEFKRHGVRAADLLPGLVDTPILTDQLRDIAPAEGMWRLVPAEEIAETVWAAYHGDQLHWYVPAELREFHKQVVAAPELVREQRAALSV